MFYFEVALVGFLIASYFDLKTREIPPTIPYSLIAIGLVGHYFTDTQTTFISGLLMAFITFVFSYALYKTGVWAGGDVKLFTALGFILPTFGKIDFFPFFVFATALFAIFPFMIIYVAYYLARNRRAVLESRKNFKRSFKRAVTSIPFLLALLFLTSTLTPLNFVYSLTMSIIFFFGWESFKIARKYVLREVIPVKLLKEGMIPAQDVFTSGRKVILKEPTFFELLRPKSDLIVDSRKAMGITDEQVKTLKKLGVKELEIKKSLPLVPVFAIGMVILLFLEKLLYS